MVQYQFLVLFAVAMFMGANGQVEQSGLQTNQGGPNQEQGGLHIDQEGHHQNQGARLAGVQNPTNWTTCDPTAVPKISCHDCNTRLICKPVGGLLKICNGLKRYCNNGICSSMPSPDCA